MWHILVNTPLQVSLPDIAAIGITVVPTYVHCFSCSTVRRAAVQMASHRWVWFVRSSHIIPRGCSVRYSADERVDAECVFVCVFLTHTLYYDHVEFSRYIS